MAILSPNNSAAAYQASGTAKPFFDQCQDRPARRNGVRIRIVVHHDQILLKLGENGDQTVRLRRAGRFELWHLAWSPGPRAVTGFMITADEKMRSSGAGCLRKSSRKSLPQRHLIACMAFLLHAAKQ